jgi:hypothetical protein
MAKGGTKLTFPVAGALKFHLTKVTLSPFTFKLKIGLSGVQPNVSRVKISLTGQIIEVVSVFL